MKKKILTGITLVALLFGGISTAFAEPQNQKQCTENSAACARQSFENLGQDIEGAAEASYNTVKEGTVNTYNKAKKGTVKAYNKTKKGARKAYRKAKKGTVNTYNKAKKGTVKAYDKTKAGAEKAYDKTKEFFQKL